MLFSISLASRDGPCDADDAVCWVRIGIEAGAAAVRAASLWLLLPFS